MDAEPFIVEDRDRKTFKLNRRALVDDDVYARERIAVFSRTWIYVGHDSELAGPGAFKTRSVAGRPVIFCRDQGGQVHVLLNTCRHRGALVCREREGTADRFTCVYHGWSYATDGSLAHVPGADSYGPAFDRADFGLIEAPRVESYRDFWFVNFDPDAESLHDNLAGARDYIDLVTEQSPSGKMEIIRGAQEYDIAANWKLLVENSFDDYHLHSTHTTWLEYMKDSGVNTRVGKGLLLPTPGVGKGLGNGHACVDNVNFRGRPVAAWISIYGEEAKPEIAAIRAELVERLGEERARRVADTNRNLIVFPNLVINDGSSVTVRTFEPAGPMRMRVTAWALGPVEESESARARRLDSFLTFYGPGGFATPDDVEVLELVQQGLGAYNEVRWSDISRGMNKEGDQLNSDESHLRAFWRRWNELMTS